MPDRSGVLSAWVWVAIAAVLITAASMCWWEKMHKHIAAAAAVGGAVADGGGDIPENREEAEDEEEEQQQDDDNDDDDNYEHDVSSSRLQQQRTVTTSKPDGGNVHAHALMADCLALGKMLAFALFVLLSVLPDGAVDCSGLEYQMVVQNGSRLISTNPWLTPADVRDSCIPSVPAAGFLRKVFVGCMVINSGLFLSCMLLRYSIRSGRRVHMVKDATVAAMWLGSCIASWSKMAIAISFTDLHVHFAGKHADGHAIQTVRSDIGSCSFVSVPSTQYHYQNNMTNATATCPLQLDCDVQCTLAPNSVEIVSSSLVFVLSLSYFSYMTFELWKSLPARAAPALAAARDRLARHTNALFFTIADLSNLLKYGVTVLNMALILDPQGLVTCNDLAGPHHPTIKSPDIRQACWPSVNVEPLEPRLLFL